MPQRPPLGNPFFAETLAPNSARSVRAPEASPLRTAPPAPRKLAAGAARTRPGYEIMRIAPRHLTQRISFLPVILLEQALRFTLYRRMPTAKTPTKRKPNAALMKPVQPDAVLSAVVGPKAGPRGELTKRLWDYIKKNNLQDAKKRTMINADDALKVVFGGKKQVSMFEMTKLVSKHIN